MDVEYKAAALFFAGKHNISCGRIAALIAKKYCNDSDLLTAGGFVTVCSLSSHKPRHRSSSCWSDCMACLVCAGAGEVPITTKVILSSHNFNETPSVEELQAKAEAMRDAGADIVKIATMANDISDAATVLSLLQNKSGGRQSGIVIVPNTSVLCSGDC